MIDLSIITKALQDQLNSNIGVIEFLRNSTVIRGEFINDDPNQTPWAGIYRGKVTYEPRTLGSMNNWEAKPTVRIIIQASDLRSAEDCETALEGYVKTVMDAIIEDTTIGGTVDIITGFDVEVGYIETDRSNMHFQGASITLHLEVATQ